MGFIRLKRPTGTPITVRESQIELIMPRGEDTIVYLASGNKQTVSKPYGELLEMLDPSGVDFKA